MPLPRRAILTKYGNGLETRYSYYGLDTPQWGNSYYSRLLQACVIGQGTPTCPYDSVGTAKLNLIYGYDNVGNVAGTRDWTNDNQVQWYTYDALDRLVRGYTQALGGGTDQGRYDENYAYNAIGNVISKTGVTYGYNDTLHKHAATHLNGVQKYWYDANGNMTRRVEGSVTYTQTWDIENRLTVVTATNGIAITVTRFTYDGDGQRVKKTEGVTTTVYVGAIYEKNVTTGVMTTYYYAGATRVAVRQGGVLYYLHGDHLGSASLTTNASGSKYGELRYKPYGETRYTWGATPTDRRFTGQRSDAYINLTEMGARWYDSQLGRWVSPDSIVPQPGDPQTLNRYSYANNNPLKYVDSNGHFAIPAFIVIGVGIAMVAGGIAAAQYNLPPLFGTAPDYRGLWAARGNQAAIESYAQSEGIPSIMVGAGIGVQDQWSFQDWAEVNLQHDLNPSVGIAQMTPGEMQKYVGGGSALDSNLAVLAMTRKIKESVTACTGCSTTDKFIVAGMAQNGFGSDAVQEVSNRYRDNNGSINWASFFASQQDRRDSLKDKWLAFRSSGRGWNRFQLQLFLNDLQALQQEGWQLPSDVNLPYMQCLASGGGECAP